MSHGCFRTHNVQDSESRPPAGGMTAGHRRSAKGSRPVAHLAGQVFPGMLVFGTKGRPVMAWRWSICARPPSGRRGRRAVGTHQQRTCHQLEQEGGRLGRTPHVSSAPRPGSVPPALSGSGPATWLGHQTSPPVAYTRGNFSWLVLRNRWNLTRTSRSAESWTSNRSIPRGEPRCSACLEDRSSSGVRGRRNTVESDGVRQDFPGAHALVRHGGGRASLSAGRGRFRPPGLAHRGVGARKNLDETSCRPCLLKVYSLPYSSSEVRLETVAITRQRKAWSSFYNNNKQVCWSRRTIA